VSSLSDAAQVDINALLDGLERGDRGVVSAALNLVDDRRPAMREPALALLDGVERRFGEGRAHRIGVTGAPGAGKSTLLNALVEEQTLRNRSIAIVAVDPSSQRTGGALLGDRMRLGATARERGVFLRSMAARDRLGGLADATHASVTVLSAAFDIVFVETVGIGQSECEVADLADTLLFIAQPGAGDVIQFMKAGILELPDVFVVNKADTGALAERTRNELGAGLGLGGQSRDAGWRPPTLLTSARDRSGIDVLAETLDAHRAHLEASGELLIRRRAGSRALVRESLMRRYGEYGLETIGGLAGVEARLDAADSASAFQIALEIGAEIEARLPGHTTPPTATAAT
jgi:LAO/AO transport system kinase